MGWGLAAGERSHRIIRRDSTNGVPALPACHDTGPALKRNCLPDTAAVPCALRVIALAARRSLGLGAAGLICAWSSAHAQTEADTV